MKELAQILEDLKYLNSLDYGHEFDWEPIMRLAGGKSQPLIDFVEKQLEPDTPKHDTRGLMQYVVTDEDLPEDY